MAKVNGVCTVDSAVNTALIRLVIDLDANICEAKWCVNTEDLPYDYWAYRGYGASYRSGLTIDDRGFPIVDSVWDVVWVLTGLSGTIDLYLSASAGKTVVFELEWTEGAFKMSYQDDAAVLTPIVLRFVGDVSPSDMLSDGEQGDV